MVLRTQVGGEVEQAGHDDQLSETNIACPYCGETTSVLIDESIEEQNYIEDCQVCCRPIVFKVTAYPGEEPRVEVRREDD